MIKSCLTCKKAFNTKDKRQKYCSFSCVYDKNSERNKIIKKQKTGIKYSDEYKRNMSQILKGKNTWLKGRKQSAEHIKNKSLAQKGIKHNWTGFRNPKEESRKRSERNSLSGNPNWQGGKSFEKYPFAWTETLRQSIRERDNYSCQVCGITEKEYGKKLDIHHINHNKNDCNYGNLVTLCKHCHIKTHGIEKKMKKIDLRSSFGLQIDNLMEHDKNIILLTADLGFKFLDNVASKYPEQFLNVGASEQHMVGMAQGLALGGKKPYCYSGAIFALMRPYEQIRHACYNNLDIKIIGTGASGFLGFSHNLLGTENEEDLLKNLPNIKRFYPKDEVELSLALTSKGIAYIRL